MGEPDRRLSRRAFGVAAAGKLTGRRFLFLYPGESRRQRLDALDSGTVPREFFYGYLALRDAGYDCAIADTRTDPVGAVNRLLLRFEILRSMAANFGVSRQRVEALAGAFAESDVAISFTDGFSIGMGLWARRLAPRARLVGGFHGLADSVDRAKPWAQPIVRRQIERGLAGLDHLFFFGEPDRLRTLEMYPSIDPASTSVFPFGIDTDFWTPALDGADDPVVFAAGSDPQRDYATLAAAPTRADLRILTRLDVPPRATGHVELIRGSWHNAAVTDMALRELYRRARVVTVPLRDVWQPSGYSVTLQAMACGKPVVLSGIRGLWDPGVLKSGHDCIIVPPGDPAALGAAIDALMADEALRTRIGAAARQTALERFPLARMNRAILDLGSRFSARLAS